MTDRPKLTSKRNAQAARDPARKPVRGINTLNRKPLPPAGSAPPPRKRPPGPALKSSPSHRADHRFERRTDDRGIAAEAGFDRPWPDRPKPGPMRPSRTERPHPGSMRHERPEHRQRFGPETPPMQGPHAFRAERTFSRDAQAPLPSPRPARPPGGEAPTFGVRLSKVMATQAMASRREADDWIAAGWVRVDGRVAVLGQRIRGDERIDIDPAARGQQQRRMTVLLNKPIGFVSGQAEDGHEPAVVLVKPGNRWVEDQGLPWHPSHLRGLAPAGRLDIDSTGLLVLTQDGRIARHLIGEDSDVEKEYLVRVEPLGPGSFPEDGLERLRHGLELDGRPLRPAKVSWANEDQLRFVLREGRKRQIRRMCELVGLKVTGLKRVRIGSVVLGKLPPGQWRYLRDDERF
jgi:23S rRNA pseudouridine2604 synthase